MTHEDEVAFIMGEVGGRALNPLPLSRDIRPRALERMARADEDVRPHDPVAGGRLGRVRRLLVRLLGAQFARQETFNREVVLALRDVEALTTIIEERLKSGWINLDYRIGGTQSELTRIENSQFDIAQSIGASVGAVDARLVDLEGGLADSEARAAAEAERFRVVDEELAVRKAELSVLRTRLENSIATRPSGGHADVVAPRTHIKEELHSVVDDLYVAFEATFRGSREEVKSRQSVYLDDVRAVGGELPVLDIGPGRGEWLEMLAAEGIPAYGVDLNPALVGLAQTYDLDVRIGDAVEHLMKVGERELRAVSAFHVVEHLPIDDVVALVDAALVALQPGGILILETPNPTNLVVGACGFYLDPTHLRPMHPQLLEFLVANRGFAGVEVRYLHPVRDVSDQDSGDPFRTEMAWSLFGPQDYAVVAKKPHVS